MSNEHSYNRVFRGPSNLLAQIEAMRNCREQQPELTTALSTLERHLNYLSPELVIFALFDDEIEVEQKNEMAAKLMAVADLWTPGERLIYAPSFPGPNFCLGDVFWQGRYKNNGLGNCLHGKLRWFGAASSRVCEWQIFSSVGGVAA